MFRETYHAKADGRQCMRSFDIGAPWIGAGRPSTDWPPVDLFDGP